MTAPVRVAPFGDQSDLLCPRCHDRGNLHHRRVEVFYRAEDARAVRLIAIEAGQIIALGDVPNDWSANPSLRRDGICIHFDCEQCGDGLIFNVAQHKGNTFLSWTIEPVRAES